MIITNPAERVAAPGYSPREREHWSLPETQRFIATALTERGQHVPMLLFLLGTGLRRGECTALTWEDIDRAAGTVRVAKAIAFVRNRPVLQATKTRAGTRTVSLTDLALAALDLLPVRGEPTARIFTSGCGTPPTPSNVRTALHRLCDRAGVPRIPPHGLRHAHVSLLIAAGVDVLAISRRVGHARSSTTWDIYGHAMRPDDQAAAGFDRLLAPPESA